MTNTFVTRKNNIDKSNESGKSNQKDVKQKKPKPIHQAIVKALKKSKSGSKEGEVDSRKLLKPKKNESGTSKGDVGSEKLLKPKKNESGTDKGDVGSEKLLKPKKIESGTSKGDVGSEKLQKSRKNESRKMDVDSEKKQKSRKDESVLKKVDSDSKKARNKSGSSRGELENEKSEKKKSDLGIDKTQDVEPEILGYPKELKEETPRGISPAPPPAPPPVGAIPPQLLSKETTRSITVPPGVEDQKALEKSDFPSIPTPLQSRKEDVERAKTPPSLGPSPSTAVSDAKMSPAVVQPKNEKTTTSHKGQNGDSHAKTVMAYLGNLFSIEFGWQVLDQIKSAPEYVTTAVFVLGNSIDVAMDLSNVAFDGRDVSFTFVLSTILLFLSSLATFISYQFLHSLLSTLIPPLGAAVLIIGVLPMIAFQQSKTDSGPDVLAEMAILQGIVYGSFKAYGTVSMPLRYLGTLVSAFLVHYNQLKDRKQALLMVAVVPAVVNTVVALFIGFSLTKAFFFNQLLFTVANLFTLQLSIKDYDRQSQKFHAATLTTLVLTANIVTISLFE